jgi:hypothetical protein
MIQFQFLKTLIIYDSCNKIIIAPIKIMYRLPFGPFWFYKVIFLVKIWNIIKMTVWNTVSLIIHKCKTELKEFRYLHKEKLIQNMSISKFCVYSQYTLYQLFFISFLIKRFHKQFGLQTFESKLVSSTWVNNNERNLVKIWIVCTL